MKSLACLKDELVRLQNEDSNSSESSLNNIIQVNYFYVSNRRLMSKDMKIDFQSATHHIVVYSQDQDSTASSSASRTSVVMSTQASQTDLAGEMVPIGARLAEMARLRLDFTLLLVLQGRWCSLERSWLKLCDLQ